MFFAISLDFDVPARVYCGDDPAEVSSYCVFIRGTMPEHFILVYVGF
jgi:hypothetical protein